VAYVKKLKINFQQVQQIRTALVQSPYSQHSCYGTFGVDSTVYTHEPNVRIKQFCLSCQDSDGRDSVLTVYEGPLMVMLALTSLGFKREEKKQRARA